MKKWICLSFVIPIFLLTGCGFEIDPRTIYANRKGQHQMKEGSYAEAQRFYLEALALDPFISELHTNLGLTYHALKQGDQALQSYESADKWAQNPQASFAARFNQGVLRGENKKIEEALMAYQRALDVVPNSIEAKTNIELLIQSQSQQGEGENKDQDQDQDQQGGQGQSEQQKQDQGENENDKKDQPKEYGKNQEYKPREFKGDLSEADVKKILGELKQQEQKIRGQFHRNEFKEKPREKDW